MKGKSISSQLKKYAAISSLTLISTNAYSTIVTIDFEGHGYSIYQNGGSITELSGATLTTSDSLSGSITYDTNGTYTHFTTFADWTQNYYDTTIAVNATFSGVNGSTSLAYSGNGQAMVEENPNPAWTTLRFFSQENSPSSSGAWQLQFDSIRFQGDLTPFGPGSPPPIPDSFDWDGSYNATTHFDIDLLNTETNETATLRARLTSFETVSQVPVPAAAWLFGSAIIGLFGFKRKLS